MPDIVSNTGPLIALASIGQLDLLRSLFGRILIPPAVRAEVQDETSVAALTAANWIVGLVRERVCVAHPAFVKFGAFAVKSVIP